MPALKIDLPSSSKKTGRYSGIDSGKLIAAFGVILIHIAPSTSITERFSECFSVFAVSFFLFASIRFFIPSLSNKPLDQLGRLIVSRIAIPYLVWTLIYLAAFVGKDFFTTFDRPVDCTGAVIYGAATVHLYFLPLLASIQLLLILASLSFRRHVGVQLLASIGFLSVALIASYGFVNHYVGWNLVPSFPIFAVGSWFLARFDDSLKASKLALCFGTALLAIAILQRQIDFGLSHKYLPIDFLVGGLGFYLISLHLPAIAPASVLKASYGIYLSHFLLVEGCEFALQRCGFAPKLYSFLQELVFAAIVFFTSLTLVQLLRKSKILAGPLLGEWRS